MVSYFSGFTTVPRSTVIPHCPNCSYNTNVQLVDSTITNDVTYSDGTTELNTLPVWHCSSCDKLFGERTYAVDSTLTNQMPKVRVDTSSAGAIGYISTPKWDIDCRLRTVETSMESLKNSVDKLQTEVKEQKKDILSSLRDRVEKFVLV